MKRNETYLGTIKFGLPWIFSVGAELRLAGLFPPNLFPFNSNRAALCKYNYSLLKNYKVRVHSFLRFSVRICPQLEVQPTECVGSRL